MPVALVTGASGFCARHLVERISQEPSMQVVGTGRSASVPSWLTADTYLSADFAHPQSPARILAWAKPDMIFHLAGTTEGGPGVMYPLHFEATVRLLEAVRMSANPARVLLVGTAAEYGPVPSHQMPVTEATPCQPASAYGASKLAASLAGLHYARHYGLRVVIARPFNVIGAGVPGNILAGAVLTRVAAALKQGEPTVKTGSLDAHRDFIDVRDAADAFWKILMSERWGEVFNVCSGVATPVESLVTELLSYAPRPLKQALDLSLGKPSEIPVSYGSREKLESLGGKTPPFALTATLKAAWDQHFI